MSKRQDDEHLGPMRVVRRPETERRRLSPELEAFARGETDKVRVKRPQGPRLDDPRSVYLIPGVANRHARAAAEAALAALQVAVTAHKKGDSSALGPLLADALRTRWWRGKSITSFEALAEGFLDLNAEEAIEIAKKTGFSLEPLDDRRAALLLRMRGALAEEGVAARAEVSEDGQHVHLDVGIEAASRAFATVGKALAPLAVDRKAQVADGGPKPRRVQTEAAPRGGGFGPRKKF